MVARAEDIADEIFKFLAEVVISGRQIVGLVLNADQRADVVLLRSMETTLLMHETKIRYAMLSAP